MALEWVLTRLLVLGLLIGTQQTIINDVLYYARNVAGMVEGGSLELTLREYPLPVLGVLTPPWLVSFGSENVYLVLFIAFMFAVDAAFTILLFRSAGRRQSTAVTLWLLAGPALGPLAITRFDLLTGVLVGAALLVLLRRPAWSGALVVVGAGLKLWPIILVPMLAARVAGRVRVLVGAGVTLAVIAVGCLAGAGLTRSLSPLTWQSERGLQIESVPALPLMIGWVTDSSRWHTYFSNYVSMEISGPGDRLMLALANLAMLGAIGLLAVLSYRAWRIGRALTPVTVGWFLLAGIGLLIVTNKVFSPQYLLWLSPVAVALVAVSSRHDVAARRWTLALFGLGILTQVIYPVTYLWLTTPYWANPLGVSMLAVRNLVLVGLVGYAVGRAWVGTRRPGRSRATADSTSQAGATQASVVLTDRSGQAAPAGADEPDAIGSR